MNAGRTILALLIALSVAMLPAAGAVGMSPKSSMQTDTATMAGTSDCCPHQANPCAKVDDCGTMATCALKCFSFAGVAPSIIVFPSSFAKMAATFGRNPLSPQMGSPPFRPPRI
jgi:hypothetical protein